MEHMLIAGNWKMHGSFAQGEALARDVAEKARASRAEVLICPPYPLLLAVAAALGDSPARLGAQDCAAHPAMEGAFTGDISAKMLKETGCSYVIVGHSERRQYHHERDETVRAKAQNALNEGLTPIICVGETLAQREAGQAEAVVAAQVNACLPGGAGRVVLAYEPVWAIGTGLTPTLDQIARMHACIYKESNGLKALYGGSVKAANAKDILSLEGVGGALVGGASLSAAEFGAIIDACAESR